MTMPGLRLLRDGAPGGSGGSTDAVGPPVPGRPTGLRAEVGPVGEDAGGAGDPGAPVPDPGRAAWPPTGGSHRWRVTAVGLTLFVLTAYLGRLTVPDGGTLSLIWPANGVLAAWFAFLGWRRSLVVDAALLFTASLLVNHATGAPWSLAAELAGYAVVLGLTFGGMLTLLAPRLWGPRSAADGPTLRSGRDVAVLMVSGWTACLAGALVTVQISWAPLLDGRPQQATELVVRNLVGVIAIVPVALLARDRWLARRAGGVTPPAARAHEARTRPFELVALYALTAALVWLVLARGDLPLSFLVLVTSVWAGLRLSPLAANLHAVAVGGTVVLTSVTGLTGFVPQVDPRTTASVTQVWVAFVVGLTMVLALDAAERRRLTAALVEARAAAADQAQTLTRVLEAMSEGVMLLGDDGRVLLRNEAGDRLLGGAASDLGGQFDPRRLHVTQADGTVVPIQDLLRGEAIEALQELGGVSPPTDLHVSGDGVEARVLEVRASAVRGRDDRPALLSVFHDVTAERRERDALASFAGVVAHDLVSPLSTITGWAEVLEGQVNRMAGDLPVPASADRALSRIHAAAAGMRTLIDDLLSYVTARDSELRHDVVDLRRVAADVAETWSAEPVQGGRPRIHVGPLPPVAGDEGQLRQVLDNLVGNAVKYVAPGVVPAVAVTATQQGTEVVLEIRDNGIGIPREHLVSIFDTFHRAPTEGYHGTGLGLSIVHRIVERHGGTITAGNHPGGGAVFRLRLPAAQDG